ncbi:MAG TPA: hypothetical protein DCZ74_09370 [Treponema sp.]|nr:hypothetical protein [Treponema sp.]
MCDGFRQEKKFVHLPFMPYNVKRSAGENGFSVYPCPDRLKCRIFYGRYFNDSDALGRIA